MNALHSPWPVTALSALAILASIGNMAVAVAQDNKPDAASPADPEPAKAAKPSPPPSSPPQAKPEKAARPAPTVSRQQVITQMAKTDDEAFHAMLYWLPETKTIFRNVIDTKNPQWSGFEYSLFKELSPERKNTLLKEITTQVTSLNDTEWRRQQRRMILWMVLFQQQRALERVYSTEPYLNAVYSVEKLRPVFAKSIAKRKLASKDFNPATIGNSVSSAEGNQLSGAVVSRMLLLQETERIQSLVQICLHLAEHAPTKTVK